MFKHFGNSVRMLIASICIMALGIAGGSAVQTALTPSQVVAGCNGDMCLGSECVFIVQHGFTCFNIFDGCMTFFCN